MKIHSSLTEIKVFRFFFLFVCLLRRLSLQIWGIYAADHMTYRTALISHDALYEMAPKAE